MGWTYYRTTKEDLIKDLTSETNTSKTIAHSLVGKHLWCVHERKTASESFGIAAGFRYICLYLLDFGGGECGYKDIDETMGPYECDCPLRFLDLAPPSGKSYSNEFRQRVREHHRKRRDAGKLEPGQAVTLYGKEYKLIRKSKSSWVGIHNGLEYKITPKHFPNIIITPQQPAPANVRKLPFIQAA